MSFGTNSKLSVWGLWLGLWVVFLVGWVGLGFLVVFYQYDTTQSLSNERAVEPFIRQGLTLSRTGLRAAPKGSMEKILLCVCSVLPLRKEKIHPTCCGNDFCQN